MSEADADPGVQVPLVWIGVDDLTVQTANQAILQLQEKDEFVLVFGHLSLPIILGPEEDRREQIKGISFAPVKPIVRLGMTRRRIEEVLHLLEQQLAQHDERFASNE